MEFVLSVNPEQIAEDYPIVMFLTVIIGIPLINVPTVGQIPKHKIGSMDMLYSLETLLVVLDANAN
jgi:hypothetical protein